MTMIRALDPVLAEKANLLKQIHFPVHEDHKERYRELSTAGPGEGFRNVISRCYGKSWAVRMYLGGKQRAIGTTTDVMDALRFADMCLMRFWVYRTRNACEPIESDLNFGLESVRDDMASDECQPAVDLINVIEQHLVSTGVFPSLIASEEERLNVVKEMNKRRTICGQMDKMTEGICAEFDKLTAYIQRLEKQIGDLKLTIEKNSANTSGEIK